MRFWGLLRSSFVILLLPLGAWAQKPSGLSAILDEGVKPFTYMPVDPDFWQGVVRAQEDKKFLTMISLGAGQEKKFGVTGPEGAEGRMAVALGLRGEKLLLASFFVSLDLARDRLGTMVGEMSLRNLNELSQETVLDETLVNDFILSNEFKNLHPDQLSFVSFYKAFDDLAFGFSNWAKIHFDRIDKTSHWGQQVDYLKGLALISRGKVDEAHSFFKAQALREGLSPGIKEKLAIQLARLEFEKGQFEKSYELYETLAPLPLRERGRINLERAWTQYYAKNYSKAMGLLRGLRAPMFDPSITPERYILEMIIFKELCHYRAVEANAADFRKRFASALTQIRERKPLRENKELLSMAVMSRQVQDQANLVHQIREERKAFQDYGWDHPFSVQVLRAYDRSEERLQMDLDRTLEPLAREQAEILLDAEEQVLFLEYTARLDALRIVPRGEEREYKSDKVSYLTFENVFWPVGSEYWSDEFETYKMLISSRCTESQTDRPSEEKLEEETFK